MKKHLNFICPSDYLEAVIKNTLSGEHYFLSSLGISLAFDERNLRHIKDTLEINDIRDISFILSEDNRFVLDALGNRDHKDQKNLQNFYDELREEKENCRELWQAYDRKFLILSRYLNNKIKALQDVWDLEYTCRLSIDAKIYNRQEDTFNSIYPALIFREGVSLN